MATRSSNTYPHEITAFTQGLIFRNGELWEGHWQAWSFPGCRGSIWKPGSRCRVHRWRAVTSAKASK